MGGVSAHAKGPILGRAGALGGTVNYGGESIGNGLIQWRRAGNWRASTASNVVAQYGPCLVRFQPERKQALDWGFRCGISAWQSQSPMDGK